jgi:hypothetical protein
LWYNTVGLFEPCDPDPRTGGLIFSNQVSPT